MKVTPKIPHWVEPANLATYMLSFENSEVGGKRNIGGVYNDGRTDRRTDDLLVLL